MPLTQEEKDRIVERVVEILKSPQKNELIEALRKSVLEKEEHDDADEIDDVIYSVIQAINELYG
ncbi:MAG: hypothetical protein JW881_03940 [Spirochaetales bacterium]|nr:hypothetical protein [Spirochaetales bacterium]